MADYLREGNFRHKRRPCFANSDNVGWDGSLRGTVDYNGDNGFNPEQTSQGSVSVNLGYRGSVQFDDSQRGNVFQSVVIARDGQEISFRLI